MDPSNDQRELREYLSVVGRRKTLIAAVTLTCGLLALIVSLLETPTYRATAELLFESGSARLIVDPSSQRIGDPQRLLQNEVQFLESERVSEAAEAELGFTGNIEVVVSQPTGDIMFVSAEADDPDDAAAIANAHSEAYISERRAQAVDDYRDTIEVTRANLQELERTQFEAQLRVNELNAELSSPTPESDVSLLTSERNALQANQGTLFDEQIRLSADLRELELGFDLASTEVASITVPAEPPAAPISPKPVRNTIIGMIVGLVLGVGVAFVRDYLDDTIKTKDRLELALNRRIPTMALIPQVDDWEAKDEARLISMVESDSPATEGYRALRTSLSFVNLEETPQVIQLTSAEAGEGKSTTAANLGVAITRAGHRVLVIDADLRRSRIHEYFDLPQGTGLVGALHQGSLIGTIQEYPDLPDLHVLVSGGHPPDPAELLASDRLERVFDELRERYEYIIIDSPPVLPVADALSLSRFADALVMVVDANSTSIRKLRRAVGLIQQIDAPLIGTVLNQSTAIDDYYEPYYRSAAAEEREAAAEDLDGEGGDGEEGSEVHEDRDQEPIGVGAAPAVGDPPPPPPGVESPD